jgi:tetratricopeptide (TPR) repeat protein
MRRNPALTAAVALLAATLAWSGREAHAQDAKPAEASAGIVAGLVRNAWYWQARARDDKAEEAWKQVLAVAPDHPEALAAVGNFDARAGRLQEARETLARLEKTSPGHPDVPVLRRAIELGPVAPAMLASARKLVHEGRVDEGVVRYRELFGAAGPPGDLALEYYHTIGGTPGGWDQARQGLERLVRRAPGEVRFRLALGKLLTYRDPTRREGIRILAEVAKQRAVAKEAVAAWRQALLWLAPTAQDAPLLRAYLEAHPRDAEVARHLERGRTAGTVQEAFAALDRGDLASAERLFRASGDAPDARRGLAIVEERRALQRRKAGFAALERGDLPAAEEAFKGDTADADSRYGLALVAQRQALEAQRQGDLGRARALLERARGLAPNRPEVWESALRSVTFWSLMSEARAARAAGQSALAEARLRDALERAPDQDRWHAHRALADVYAERGDRERAEDHYREVLTAAPEDPGALRGLASLLIDTGRFEDAVPVNEKLLRVAPQRAFRAGWLQAELHRSLAARSRAARDLPRARAELEQARRSDPTNVWALHDLANVLLETGALAEARPVVDALLVAAPQLAEARAVEARLLASEGQGTRALEILSSLPAARKDPALVALRRRLEVQVRVPAILDRARGGGRAAAVQELVLLERQVEDEPQLAGAIALAWSRLGEFDRAVALMRRAMARAPAETRGMRLELASALLEAGDDAGVAAILAGLEADRSLDAGERRWLADLRVAHAVRVADRARERGDSRAAGAALDPVLRDYPRDPRALGALARLLEPRNPRRAHGVYRRVLAAAPDDLDARRGAVDTALALGDVEAARTLAREGARRHPRDPRMHVLEARAALRLGDDERAMRSLEDAWQLAGTPPTRGGAAPASSAAALEEGAARRTSVAPDADAALRAEIGREMDRLRDRHRPGLDGAFEARRREGELGLGRVTDLRSSAAAEVPVGYRGRATFRVTQIELDAGAVGPDAAPRFGSGAADVSARPRASGAALGATYEDRTIVADAGTTPLGFPVFAVVGGLGVRHDFGAVRVGAGLARRSVTDSVLSFAGVRDPATDRYWGGVVTEGGRVDLAVEGPATRARAFASLDRLVGFHVAENRRVMGGAGADVLLMRGGAGELRAGVNVVGFGFEKNLSFFTFGHGGYFSPQRFVRGGVPLGWTGGNRFRWELVAEPGWESFEEDGSPAFPLGAPEGVEARDPYAGQTKTGFAFDGRAAAAWRIVDVLEARLTLETQRAPEYEEVRGLVMLRFGGSPAGGG